MVSPILLFVAWKVFFPPSPEDEIRGLIQRASQVIERRNLPKSLSFLSDKYQDDMGFDYSSLAYLASQVFRTYPEISVSSKILSLSVKQDQAEVDLMAEVMGRIPPDDPEDLFAWRESNRFLVFFQKEKEGWKVVGTKKPLPELE